MPSYRSIFPHVAAAIQLSNNERITKGDNIEYVYTDSQHQNPLSRVVAAQFIQDSDNLQYDKEKYKEMLLTASETALGIFGLDSIRPLPRIGSQHNHLQYSTHGQVIILLLSDW